MRPLSLGVAVSLAPPRNAAVFAVYHKVGQSGGLKSYFRTHSEFTWE